MPVRQLRKTYSSSINGLKVSTKNERSIGFESNLEKDYVSMLEYDHNVKFFEEQPVTIEYNDPDGKLRRYTPDFLVNYHTHREPAKWFKPMLVEVKHRADLWKNWTDLKPKFQSAVSFCHEKGWRFKIITEVEIRTEYLFNAKFLNRYRNVDRDMAKIDRLFDLISDLRVSTPEEIMKAASIDPNRRAEFLHTLWYMMSNDMIGFSPDLKITMKSEIWALDTEPPLFLRPCVRS